MQRPHILLILEPAVLKEDYESKYVPLLLKHLNTKEINISFVCSKIGEDVFGSYSKNIGLVRWGPTKTGGFSLVVGYVLYLIFAFLKTLSLVRKLRPHLILSLGGHTFSGVLVTVASKFTQSKSIVRIAGPTRETMKLRYTLGALFSVVASLIESFVFRFSDAFISNSTLAGYLSDDAAQKLQVVKQGVDTEIFSSDDFGNGQNGITIITVSRLSPEKRIANLIESVSLLTGEFPDIHLKIVGDGPSMPKLKQISQELKVDRCITFLGYLTQDEVRAELIKADVFVLPSLRESLPSALLEAMACRIPTIVARDWITRLEFKDQEHTIVCDASPKGISDAIIQLHKSKEYRNTIIDNAYSIIQEKYSIQSSRKSFLQVMKKLLKPPTQ